MPEIKEIELFAPATIANVSCGFDVLGCCLDSIGDTMIIRKTAEMGLRIKSIKGADLPLDPHKNVAGAAIEALLAALPEQPDFGFELEIVIREHEPVPYSAVPTTPPVERDLALVVPAGVTAADVEAVVQAVGGPLLADVSLFDEYRGKELDGRSVAWRLVFRVPDRTLREEEADDAIGAILAALKERLGVERRQA